MSVMRPSFTQSSLLDEPRVRHWRSPSMITYSAAPASTPPKITYVGPGIPMPVSAIGEPMGDESGSKMGGIWPSTQRSAFVDDLNGQNMRRNGYRMPPLGPADV